MALPKMKLPTRTANPIETASRSDDFIGSELNKASKIVKDQVSNPADDFFSQLLGMDFGEHSSKQAPQRGEMKAGESISLTELSVSSRMKPRTERGSNKENKANILAAIDYRSEVIHGSERLSRQEAREMDQRIHQIMNELKRIVDSSSMLKMEFATVSVQQAPVKAGKYYIHFFEWLLIELRKIRSQVENSGAWLNVMKSKKSQRKYGAMAKKHGTSFTLSGERTPATQTG